MSQPLGLYIHVPFCRQKCAYCDFSSYAGLEELFEPYVDAVVRDMERAAAVPVRSVYVGGGTPSVLPVALVGRLLAGARRAFHVDAGAEVSVEANPGTVSAAGLAALRALGVNRLSLGVQSLDDGELRLLGRIHTAAEARTALREVREAGFDNVSLDFIFGLPGQPLGSWQATLDRALDLGADHLSLYALTLEECTPLAQAVAAGDLPEPDPDLAADMYELAQERLAAAGYAHYEISNWARPGRECRHNLGYWRNEPYLGVGAGAHSWLGGRRQARVAWPPEYVRRVQAGERVAEDEEEIEPALEMGETMMMGLRLVDEGVGYDRFRERFGRDLRQVYAAALAALAARGLIELLPDRVRLTRRGRLLGNQAFMEFLPGQD